MKKENLLKYGVIAGAVLIIVAALLLASPLGSKLIANNQGTPIIPHKHVEVEIPAIKATCASAGHTKGISCSSCGKMLLDPEIIPKRPHSYTNDADASCNVCGYERNVQISTPDLNPGLYDNTGKVLKTWDNLVSSEIITINNGTIFCNDKNALTGTLVLPDSVKAIGDRAFQFCSSLEYIALPDDITHIGAYAFSDCENLKRIEIPANVAEIGKNAFYFCERLESVIFAEGVQIATIPSNAFANCYSLRSITIPQGVKVLEESAFAYCRNLHSITLPHGITTIQTNALSYCAALDLISFGGTSNEWVGVSKGKDWCSSQAHGAAVFCTDKKVCINCTIVDGSCTNCGEVQ
jgi:hypothetical protein